MFWLWFAGSKWPIWWYRDAYSVHLNNISFCVDFCLGNVMIATRKPMQYHPLNTGCSYDHCIVSLELGSFIQPMKCHLVGFDYLCNRNDHLHHGFSLSAGALLVDCFACYLQAWDAPSDSEIFDCWVPWYYLNAGTGWKMHSICRMKDSTNNKPRQRQAKRSLWPYWWLG